VFYWLLIGTVNMTDKLKHLIRFSTPNVLFSALFLAVMSNNAFACWTEAATRYGVDARLLYAVASVESRLNPSVINRDNPYSNTYDIGLMQINSSHLPKLAQYGITKTALLDACTNMHVGAWILAGNFMRYGVTWEAVGAYNASCSKLRGVDCVNARVKYASRVNRALVKLQQRQASAVVPK
jgi:soluble lytic murein transglycosylase-like protein